MPIEPEFLDLMPDTIVARAPGTARNLRGELTGLGEPVPHRARVVYRARALRNDAGDVVTSSTQAYVYGAPGLTTEYVITLPDGSEPPVIMVERFPDEDGPHHEIVWFGATAR